MIRGIGLRLEGPLQSWGGPAVGDRRPSLDFPTRSGVMGLIGAALGVPRQEVAKLASLQRGLGFAVRVDRRGVAAVDYHTVMAPGVFKTTLQTWRTYLQDASFAAIVVERDGLEPPLERILEALLHPRFLLYLGRKACPPSAQVLAFPRILEGDRWEDLIDSIAPAERPDSDAGVVFADADLGSDRRTRLGQRRVRDVLTGPLPRMYEERDVVQLRRPLPAAASAQGSTDGKDTIDPWFA